MNFSYSAVDNGSFNSAMMVLNLFTEKKQIQQHDHKNLFPNYGKQSPIQSAFNILNKAATEGNQEQKKILSSPLVSARIRDLNILLKDHSAFSKKATESGFAHNDAEHVKGYQIPCPQTKFKRLLEVVTLIPRIVCVCFATLLTLVFACVIALPIDQTLDLNPKQGSSIKNSEKKQDGPYSGFDIAGIVCFNSPLRGTPALDRFFKKETLDQRYRDMTIESPWRQRLYSDSLEAERNGDLKVYTYGSTLDPACYDNCHLLTENPTRNVTVSTEGHHDTMISPTALRFLNKALKEIDPSGTIPVIQLHGSGAGKYQFTIFRLVSGSQRTFAVDYAESRFGNHPKTSIANYAENEKIQSLFKRVYEVTGQKRAILVGHSMGGLVSLEIARKIRDHKSH